MSLAYCHGCLKTYETDKYCDDCKQKQKASVLFDNQMFVIPFSKVNYVKRSGILAKVYMGSTDSVTLEGKDATSFLESYYLYLESL
jgi:hypothetical protein